MLVCRESYHTRFPLPLRTPYEHKSRNTKHKSISHKDGIVGGGGDCATETQTKGRTVRREIYILCICMYACVYVYVFMSVCMYVCIYIYIDMYIWYTTTVTKLRPDTSSVPFWPLETCHITELKHTIPPSEAHQSLSKARPGASSALCTPKPLEGLQVQCTRPLSSSLCTPTSAYVIPGLRVLT
jgi:hypothetical protein